MKYSPRRNQLPLKDRLVLTFEDAVALSGFGLSTIYRATLDGRLIARKEGARTVILRADLDAWLQNLPLKPTRAETANKLTEANDVG